MLSIFEWLLSREMIDNLSHILNSFRKIILNSSGGLSKWKQVVTGYHTFLARSYRSYDISELSFPVTSYWWQNKLKLMSIFWSHCLHNRSLLSLYDYKLGARERLSVTIFLQRSVKFTWHYSHLFPYINSKPFHYFQPWPLPEVLRLLTSFRRKTGSTLMTIKCNTKWFIRIFEGPWVRLS